MQVGVPYYPEHWPRERWERDATLMREAGVALVRLGEFAWSVLEPKPGEYTTEWLKDAIDLFERHGIGVILCTPTPTYPVWLHRAYPDIHQVKADGRVVEYGQRQDACKNHPGYREAAFAVTNRVAADLGTHPNIRAWQTDNEFGCHGTARCFCEYCEKEFQSWLRRRFEGDIDALNSAWGTNFWSHTYDDFSEVSVPRDTADRANGGGQNPGLVLDFYRFSSDVQIEFQRRLIEIIRSHSPDPPITHNLMGGFSHIDYYKLAADLDVVSWDNYPFFEVAGRSKIPSGFSHELMRGLKRQNVWVMEQASGPGGWTEFPPTTEPGRMRLWAFQAVARGCDMVSFFRWRTNRFGTEQFWHGVLDHHGEPRRRYRELIDFASEMSSLSKELDQSSVPADCAVLFDYEILWSYEIQPQTSSGFTYRGYTATITDTLSRMGITADVVKPGTPLDSYPLVITPSLHICPPALARQLEEYVENGGVLILGPRSGVRDTENAIVNQVLPGELRRLAGCEVEEYDMFGGIPDFKLHVEDTEGRKIRVFGMADILEPDKTSEVLYTYSDRYYGGRAAVVRNRYGKGSCYYLGTVFDDSGLFFILPPILETAGLVPTGPVSNTDHVECIRREKDGTCYRFYLNHALEAADITVLKGGKELLTGTETTAGQILHLDSFGVAVIKEE